MNGWHSIGRFWAAPQLHRCKMTRGAFVCVALLVGGPLNAKECTRLDAAAAEAVLDYLDSWHNVHLAYTQYVHCEGNIGVSEGLSNAIAELLEDHWARLKDLVRLVHSDPGFEAFVLRHVDETIEDDSRRSIDTSARDRCPRDAVDLCAKLRTRILSLGPWHSGNVT